jgi:hypothetical protein
MNVRDRVPSPAEVARTVLAGACFAQLVIDDAEFPDPLAIGAAEDGRLSVVIEPGSPVLDVLAANPVALLRVDAPAPFGRLEIIGAFGRCPASVTDAVVFSIALLKLRFAAARTVAVPLSAYYAASPDPLREHASEMVAHLERGHSQGLLDCLRAHGMTEANAVVPRVIDRYGLELGVITSTGVATARLAFPGGPVTSVREVAAHLRVVLTCAGKRPATE